MGPLLRPYVAPGGLEGVDLSPKMIDVARSEKRGYDKLEVGEGGLEEECMQSGRCPKIGVGRQAECITALGMGEYS